MLPKDLLTSAPVARQGVALARQQRLKRRYDGRLSCQRDDQVARLTRLAQQGGEVADSITNLGQHLDQLPCLGGTGQALLRLAKIATGTLPLPQQSTGVDN